MSKAVKIKDAPHDVWGLVWVADKRDGAPIGWVKGIHRSPHFAGLPSKGVAEGFTGDWKITHWHPYPDAPDA